jgi:hypothetical protein
MSHVETKQTLDADNASAKTSRIYAVWVAAHFGVAAIATLLWIALLGWLLAQEAVNLFSKEAIHTSTTTPVVAPAPQANRKSMQATNSRTISCNEWLDAESNSNSTYSIEKEKRSVGNQQWVMGFIAGASHFGQKDLLTTKHPKEIIAYVTDKCKLTHSATIDDITMELETTLGK